MLRKIVPNASLQRNGVLALASKHRLASRFSQMEGDPGSAAIPAEGFWDGKKFPNTSMASPRVIFPWRHDTELLPRLVPGSDEFKLQGGYFGPGDPFPLKTGLEIGVYQSLSAFLIGVPLHKVPFSGWKQELALSSSWAFTQAVAAMMSNLYRVPFDNVRPESGNFDVTLKHTTTIPTEESVEEDETCSSSSDIEYMLEERLRKMYKHAHASGRDQLQIHLQMQVTSAKLLSLMALPYLSREDAEKNRVTPSISGVFQELLSSSAEVYRKRNYKHTVIAQVLVDCDEVFCVTDLRCGSVLQGYDDGKVRNVPHLVRLESVIDIEEGIPFLRGWQITDWDDMLGGNLWYQR